MWYLYLDESGDLGFDFVNKKPSKFFTIAVVAVDSIEENRKLIKAVRLTLRRKLNPPNKRKRIVYELKGSSTTIEVKKYFYRFVQPIRFGVYAVTLNKRRVYERLTKEKARVYNFISRHVLDRIPFEKNAGQRVEMIVDKSKSKPEIVEFNTYIRHQLEARLPPSAKLDVFHWSSQDTPGLQAADVFCWGIFQKYERKDEAWLAVFREKLMLDEQYL